MKQHSAARNLRLALIIATTCALVALTGPAATAASCPGIGCSATKDGIDVTSTQENVLNLPKGPGDDGKGIYQPAADAPRYEYGSTTSCVAGARPGDLSADAMCTAAVTACANPANGPGPLTRIWRRQVQDGQPPTEWVLVGVTCWADAVPGGRPPLTMAMIQEAFNRTPWATPQVSTQPVGNVTLVGLDTYYRVTWTEQGFQPGEVDAIDPARMNGYRVDIRVRLVGFLWKFGDGQTFGPTTSEGGTYPSGGITHPYLKAGAYPANVVTTFAGDFRVDGGQWAPIPQNVAVPGPATTVTVRSAQAELVAR